MFPKQPPPTQTTNPGESFRGPLINVYMFQAGGNALTTRPLLKLHGPGRVTVASPGDDSAEEASAAAPKHALTPAAKLSSAASMPWPLVRRAHAPSIHPALRPTSLPGPCYPCRPPAAASPRSPRGRPVRRRPLGKRPARPPWPLCCCRSGPAGWPAARQRPG